MALCTAALGNNTWHKLVQPTKEDIVGQYPVENTDAL